MFSEFDFQPLSGIRALTLAINVPGPVAAARLSELGATVVKVEPPGGDPLSRISPAWYESLTRDQKILRLNLKEPDERAQLNHLLEASDLLITATRSSALDRLSLGWTQIHANFPRISQVAIIGHLPPNDETGMLDKIGQRGQDTCELFFDDVRVPTANLLGTEEGKGFAQMMEQLPYERTMVGVGAVAAMERAIEITAEYVKERKMFGKTLFDLQNTRFKLAECKTEAYIARVFIDHCIQQVIAGTLDTATAAMAKWWLTDKQFQIADECLQLHGGYGYSLEYEIAHIWADSRVQRIYGGANEVMKELVARSL